MELIPILSTIILIATISTFILAIGAYILYKVRERKRERSTESHEKEVEAEVISPAYPPDEIPVEKNIKKEFIGTQAEAHQTVKEKVQEEASLHKEEKLQEEKENLENVIGPAFDTDKYSKYDAPAAKSAEKIKEKTIRHWNSSAFKDSKFIKYTSEGYVAARDNDSGAKKWR